jgi:hypothetical protein
MSKQTKNTSPWLWVGLGLAVFLCLCIVVLGIGYAYFIPSNSTTEAIIEEPATVVVAEPTLTLVPATGADQGNSNPHFAEAAPVGIYVNLDETLAFAVVAATRPADDIVSNGNSFNTTAPAGEEYLMVNADVICSRPIGEACSFTPNVLKVVLSDGSTRDLQIFIQGVEGLWDTTVEITGGANEQGKLFFILPASETDIVLRYQDIYTEQSFYFQLP